MDVLIIGLSSLVTRRVLPALKALSQVEHIDVATRKGSDPTTRKEWTHGHVYDDYAEALKRTPAQLVYVSLVNSEHERWTQAALEQGKHVVVDKPAFLGAERAERMVELAAKRDLCLAEATVFGYHPQLRIAREKLAEAGPSASRISMVLSFPPMDPGNFRYQAALGGGALWDVGPYLVATSRIFFGSDPVTVDCRVLARSDANVEIAFAALGTFPGGGSLVGQFGFDAAYMNRLQVVDQAHIVEIDRAFTTPADYANTVRVTGANGQSSVDVAPADSFLCFFEHVLGQIATHDPGRLAADLLADSRLLERYRHAAGAA
jgi:NDP-hexose-3-ketoreductase